MPSNELVTTRILGQVTNWSTCGISKAAPTPGFPPPTQRPGCVLSGLLSRLLSRLLSKAAFGPGYRIVSLVTRPHSLFHLITAVSAPEQGLPSLAYPRPPPSTPVPLHWKTPPIAIPSRYHA